jgi:hypothetical protein
MTAAQIDIHLPEGLEDPLGYSHVHYSCANWYSPTGNVRISTRAKHMEVCMAVGHKHLNWLGTKYDMYADDYKHGHVTHLVVCFTNQLKKRGEQVPSNTISFNYKHIHCMYMLIIKTSCASRHLFIIKTSCAWRHLFIIKTSCAWRHLFIIKTSCA